MSTHYEPDLVSLPDMARTLSEADSKSLLAPFGIPFLPESLAKSPHDAAAAAEALGFPVAVKLCGDNVAHKTERGLVRLGLDDSKAVSLAADELLRAARPEDKATGVLVAPMVRGTREFIAGLQHDEQFGMTVLFGLGGIMTEVLADVAIRLVPIDRVDASEMLEQLSTSDLLGEFRGESAVNRDALVEVLTSLSKLATEHSEIRSVDLNPIVISHGDPIAVDALVEVAT